MKLFWRRETSPRRKPFASTSRNAREQRHDAIAVLEVGLSGAPDEQVRPFAIAETRVLLPLDVDFANMLRLPLAGTPGVSRLKVHPPTEAAIREQIRLSHSSETSPWKAAWPSLTET